MNAKAEIRFEGPKIYGKSPQIFPGIVSPFANSTNHISNRIHVFRVRRKRTVCPVRPAKVGGRSQIIFAKEQHVSSIPRDISPDEITYDLTKEWNVFSTKTFSYRARLCIHPGRKRKSTRIRRGKTKNYYCCYKFR